MSKAGRRSAARLAAAQALYQMEVADKKHLIRVVGYSQSEKHLKLILAIQQCFAEGVQP